MCRLFIAKLIAGVLIGPALALFGCVTDHPESRPFSNDWRQHNRNEKAFQNRLDRLRGGKRYDPDKPNQRGIVYMDEQGRTRVGVGGDTGLSADVDYDGGPEAEVKYKVKWDFAKPERKD